MPAAPPDPALQRLVEQAYAAHDLGQAAEAEEICLKVLERAPLQPGALAKLFEIRKAQGNASAAEALAGRLVMLDPNNLAATSELALLLFNRGDLADAELHARNAVRLGPQDAQAPNLMGMTLTEANRPQVGEYHYRAAVALLKRPSPILLANLAWNLRNQGKTVEARALYEQSVALDPAIFQTLLGWARLEETDRNFDRAEALLADAERLVPGHPTVLLFRAIVQGRMQHYDEALALLERLIASYPAGAPGAPELHEKSRLLDPHGGLDEAFVPVRRG